MSKVPKVTVPVDLIRRALAAAAPHEVTPGDPA
jgi:hypothetical protein